MDEGGIYPITGRVGVGAELRPQRGVPASAMSALHLVFSDASYANP